MSLRQRLDVVAVLVAVLRIVFGRLPWLFDIQIQLAACSPAPNAAVAWSSCAQSALIRENAKGLGDIAEVVL